MACLHILVIALREDRLVFGSHAKSGLRGTNPPEGSTSTWHAGLELTADSRGVERVTSRFIGQVAARPGVDKLT